MHPIAECAEATLVRHPHPALRLSELVELVADRIDRTLDSARLRSILEQYPDHFRVLDPWLGPWGRLFEREGRDRARDVWVLAVGDPVLPPDATSRPRLKLRESVRWLGRGIDPRSPDEVSRWYAIALSERAIREQEGRRAA